jgi:hypothetical protein
MNWNAAETTQENLPKDGCRKCEENLLKFKEFRVEGQTPGGIAIGTVKIPTLPTPSIGLLPFGHTS